LRTPPVIAIEGIDGTGKGTQARMLVEALEQRGLEVELFSFPAYSETLAGSLIGAYLNGEMGEPRTIDSRLTAVLFALDRYEMKARIDQARDRGATVLCDRYVGSNLAHQAARTAPKGRRALRAMVERLEYEVFGLPRPDLVLLLDMPDRLAQERVRLKGARAYTQKALDAHEADREHLRAALAEYRRQARANPERWAVIRTVERGGAPRTREAIHADIVAELKARRLLGRQRR
jgi:dTMP kinase